MIKTQRNVCPWALKDPLSLTYHDTEWGIPLHDDHKLFELLILELFQAGLNWQMILAKRDDLRRALAGFDPIQLSAWDDSAVERCLGQPNIVRNKRKISAAVINAKAFLATRSTFGSFDRYLWQWVSNRPVINAFETIDQVPNQSSISAALSHDLKNHGFTFVGPVIVYSFMQAAGLVCDHLKCCDQHPNARQTQAATMDRPQACRPSERKDVCEN